MTVGLISSAGHGEASDVADRRVEVDAVGGLGDVVTLHAKTEKAVAHRGPAHELFVLSTPRVAFGFGDGVRRAAVLDQAPLDPRQAIGSCLGFSRLVDDDVVVVQRGDRTAFVAVHPERHRAHDESLHMEHDVPADLGVGHPRQ